jgi:hypothetical protein
MNKPTRATVAQALNRSRLYPLADRLRPGDWKKLGVKPFLFGNRANGQSVEAVLTGVFRQPVEGEWYLSGAIPEAYRWNSPEPCSTTYHIVKLVRVGKCCFGITTIIERP